jgi:L-ascorbate metabolism protein UlaG (beta-lactamase superfamily)
MATNSLYRLADSTAIEPLVNKWAAWTNVVAPVASSLHLKNYQVRILESFLKDPGAHAEACQNPKLRSGPFVDISPERIDEVEQLLASTRVVLQDNLELATSLIEFHNYLAKKTTGLSLEPYYHRLPEPLLGYVELLYDYYDHPIVRCVESLLYDSPYYQDALQSFRIFREINDHTRPFFQSTPRLPDSSQIDWAIPFADSRVDELFRLDRAPQPLGYIRELLDLDPASDPLLLSLLADQTMRQPERWDHPEVRIRTLGHAAALIEWNGNSILVDPYVSVIPSEGGIERFSYSSLPEKIDYVLITHLHQDHFSLETLLRLRHKVGCVVVPRSFGMFYGDLSLKLLLQKIGFKYVVELDSLESIRLPGGEITAAPFLGEHADLPHAKSGYVIRAGQQRILFGADSDCLDRHMYQHLRRILGPVQTVFLGMECVGAPLSWSCGSLLPVKPEFAKDQSRRCHGCDSSRALELLQAVGANRIYLYAMGLEPWMEHLLGLAYTPDAVQIKEAKRLVSIALQRGFDDAAILFGKGEIFLPLQPSSSTSYPIVMPNSRHIQQTEDRFLFN